MRKIIPLIICGLLILGCEDKKEESLDCAGVDGGTAEMDICGECVGGDTGNTPCCQGISVGSESSNCESMNCEGLDPENRVLCEIGYNAVCDDAPIHFYFADSLPSNYSGPDSNWVWEDWVTISASIFKGEIFPILGAYEFYYFLVNMDDFNEDDEVNLQCVNATTTVGLFDQNSFTGINGFQERANGWRVPIFASTIAGDEACCFGNCWNPPGGGNFDIPENCVLDAMKSQVYHEYHHIMSMHQMLNNYKANTVVDGSSEPDYYGPWFGEGAAIIFPYLMGAGGGRDVLEGTMNELLQEIKADESLDFECFKSWETPCPDNIFYSPVLIVAYMAYKSSWQIAMVDCFRAMGLQQHPGDFDQLLLSLVGKNENDFLNEALDFFRLESTTTYTLMPPDLPVDQILSPPQLLTLD